jgi:cytochrome d ubiquinol oxidase subunit I
MFEGWDATFLARIQFAFTITFHIVFPAFTIGLSAFVATLHARHLISGDDVFHRLARFWTKIFAISFAMGVVSGIVLSYQFGTNWSRFAVTVGNVIGPLIGYEVLTAFFLEATFLGIMLFGWTRVSPRLMFLASLMVALGTLLSAFWILSANSWMQYPTGHAVTDGIAYPVDWWAVVFNPTFPYRFAHMVTAAYLTTSIVVMAVGARYMLGYRYADEARVMLRMGLGMAILLAPLQAVIGDLHGSSTKEHQPGKLAAIEAHWDGAHPAPLVLFAWPNAREERNDYEVAIPKLGSLIITHDWEGTFKGLKDFAAGDRPPVVPVFFAFRAMVGIGLLMILLAVWGGWHWLGGSLDRARGFLVAASWSWPLGFVAIIMGWMVTEIGRQPWIATGILRTVDAASPISAGRVLFSLALFVVVYGFVFTAGILYINRMIVKGPSATLARPEHGVPSSPLSASMDAAGQAAAGE